MAKPPPDAARLQATLVDFALAELVRQHRQSFQPLWTAESWAKLLIWLALNCGCSGDEAGLKHFAGALGPALATRLRRLFFTRELADLTLQVMPTRPRPRCSFCHWIPALTCSPWPRWRWPCSGWVSASGWWQTRTAGKVWIGLS
jgi:hypothetical protein